MRFMFKDDESFSFETLRAVGYTVYGGADIGEVITTAARITPGDTESWYREWRALADRIAAIADECAADGHTVSANSAYLRASNYYRTAEFFLRDDPWNDPRAADTSARAIETFRSAPEIRAHWTRVGIPYEGIELEGYYLNVSGDEPGPTLLAHGGYDSTVEEMFFAVGEAARQHGWNCLIFEGPGQGSALRLHKLPFRHDWEAVVTPVVDFALNLRGVDPDRIALLGMSMGGYLAPRAAAFEHRIAACIAYDGVLNLRRPCLNRSLMPRNESQRGMDNLIAHRARRRRSCGGRCRTAYGRWESPPAKSSSMSAASTTSPRLRIRSPVQRWSAMPKTTNSSRGSRPCSTRRCTARKPLWRLLPPRAPASTASEGALTLFHQRLFDWLDDTVAQALQPQADP